ncbi:MAG: short chain dehydrogenase [Myxococcales bacterium]|nr:short chain dehydrogenase [Myxococcales bacterium]
MKKTVLITGAAGGIGRALARRYVAREGVRLALLDFEPEPLAEIEAELRGRGAEVLALECDVTDADAVQEAVERAVERFGGLDVVIANAGTVHRSRFSDTDLSVYRKVMEVNFFGSLYTAKAALPALKRSRGLIVVTSSVAGVAPLYGRTGYAASKHALHGLFESARTELAEEGVRVMMVCPTFTRSPFEQRAMGADGAPAGTRRSMTGRIAEPEEVADAIIDGARDGRDLLVLSWTGKLAYLLSRLAPGYYARAMVERLKKGG